MLIIRHPKEWSWYLIGRKLLYYTDLKQTLNPSCGIDMKPLVWDARQNSKCHLPRVCLLTTADDLASPILKDSGLKVFRLSDCCYSHRKNRSYGVFTRLSSDIQDMLS